MQVRKTGPKRRVVSRRSQVEGSPGRRAASSSARGSGIPGGAQAGHPAARAGRPRRATARIPDDPGRGVDKKGQPVANDRERRLSPARPGFCEASTPEQRPQAVPAGSGQHVQGRTPVRLAGILQRAAQHSASGIAQLRCNRGRPRGLPGPLKGRGPVDGWPPFPPPQKAPAGWAGDCLRAGRAGQQPVTRCRPAQPPGPAGPPHQHTGVCRAGGPGNSSWRWPGGTADFGSGGQHVKTGEVRGFGLGLRPRGTGS